MLTVSEARALITTSLADADLEDVIAREEGWLARRIGPLDGERVETFITSEGDEVLRLQRPAASITVEDALGTVADAELRGWSDVVLPSDATRGWSDDVTVVYTPTDEAEVKRALITLVRLVVNESAYASQATGDYSVASSIQDQRTARWAAWRSLLRPRVANSIHIASSTGGVRSLGPVSAVATGS